MEIRWEKTAEEKFELLIERVPVFMRPLARDKISKEAKKLAQDANRSEITQKDMIDAFFKATPFGFHGPMKTDMEILGIDYKQYGHQ